MCALRAVQNLVCGHAKITRMLQLTTVLFLISFSLLAVIHYLAMKLYLYWQFLWFDLPMHFFGGAIVALGVFAMRDLRIVPRSWLSAWFVILVVVLVAVAWEVFEFYAGVVGVTKDMYVQDTAIDLVLGIVGGYVGYFVGNKLRNL